jgi:hypothetical protein
MVLPFPQRSRDMGLASMDRAMAPAPRDGPVDSSNNQEEGGSKREPPSAFRGEKRIVTRTSM